MRRPRLFALTTLLAAIYPFALAQAEDASSKTAAGGTVDLIREYEADHRDVTAAFALPGSSAGLERKGRLQREWLGRLRALPPDKVDLNYVLLQNEVERSLDEVGRDQQDLSPIEKLLGFRGTILALEEARRQARPIDPQAAAGELDQLARKVKELREGVEKAHKAKSEGKGNGPLAVAHDEALRAAELVKRLQATLETWFKFYNGSLPAFDWWVTKPYDEARKQLDDYVKLLREEMAGQKGKPDDPLLGRPIGKEALAAAIRFEFLPYSAEELIAIGQHELAWCEREMQRASREMGLGDDWKSALAKVKADYVPPGRQDQLVAEIAQAATEFVEEHKLVVVPPLCRQTWRLSMMSPEQMKEIPYAAYNGREMWVAYAKESMSQDEKLMVMRGNNRHFMRTVTPHEVIPGHHLQHFYNARYGTDRQLFSTPFATEGWALYWELRLWDLGWVKQPEDRIGMLFWRMTRAARIIVSLNYHLGRMTPDEMVEFLVNRVGHEKFGATSEVRRFLQAPPLYQAAYLLGGRQLYTLQKELVGSGRMTEEQFHDAVLKESPIPVELIRADLLGLPMSREMKPSWRFAGDPLAR
jgi:hypothetical protein